MNLNNLIIIDVESTGLSNESYPIEIGFKEGFKDPVSQLINPKEANGNWDDFWCFEGEMIHNIPKEELYQSGSSPWTTARFLNKYLDSKTVYSDAPNFDIFWVNKLYEDCGLDRKFQIKNLYSLLIENDIHEEYVKEYEKTREHIIHRTNEDTINIFSIIEKITNDR